MTDLRGIDDLGPLDGRRVLVRVDFNVPLKGRKITDTARIEATLPTLESLLATGARVVLVSHLGRPGGKPVRKLSLRPVAAALEKLAGRAVEFVSAPIGDGAAKAVAASEAKLILLENIRFYRGESENDPDFAAALAELADVFVNDAFSVAHRAHASTVGVAGRLPSAAGPALIGEIAALESALENPARPLAAVVGGAKISTKIALLENLVRKVDHLIIGGAMANTFLAGLGRPVGASLCEHGMTSTANEILAAAGAAGCKIHLPAEVVVAKALEEGVEATVKAVADVAEDDMILDIGPVSVVQLGRLLHGCRTLIWNGPLGAFEVPPFDKGTKVLAAVAADMTATGKLLSVAGGGDTLAALAAAGLKDKFSHVSMGGGAFLDWMAGGDPPALAPLRRDG